MPPPINHWIPPEEKPKVGTRFTLHPEGAAVIDKRINTFRSNLPRVDIQVGTELRVSSDFNVVGRPDQLRLETLDRCESVVVGREEDLFDKRIPSGEPPAPRRRVVRMERAEE